MKAEVIFLRVPLSHSFLVLTLIFLSLSFFLPQRPFREDQYHHESLAVLPYYRKSMQ